MNKTKTSWRELLSEELLDSGEYWHDVEANTMTNDDMDKEFYSGFGSPNGCDFTVWTKSRVYFPVTYDGSEWVGSVPRNPNGEKTSHVGGC